MLKAIVAAVAVLGLAAQPALAQDDKSKAMEKKHGAMHDKMDQKMKDKMKDKMKEKHGMMKGRHEAKKGEPSRKDESSKKDEHKH